MSAARASAGGFTLVELVITVAIVSVLAAVALPFAELTVKRHKEQELRTALRDIRSAIDAYKRAVDQGRVAAASAEQSGYPPTLDVLVTGVEDARSKDRHRIYFLRRLPRDPFFPDAKANAAATWGKRSYASAPDAPREGDDVYDVFSLSQDAGLNGVAYASW